MRGLIKIFFLGMLISFAGSLPLGTMNVAATQISVRDGVSPGLMFAFGSMLVELLYVRIIVQTMQWVNKRVRLFRLLGWITVIILLAMSIGSMVAGFRLAGVESSLPVYASHHFLYGAFLSAINPLHFVFWFGWSSVLLAKGWLRATSVHYYSYLLGIGIGTLAGFTVFIYGGSWLVGEIKDKQYILNWVIGIVLLVTALIQARKIYVSPKLGYKI